MIQIIIPYVSFTNISSYTLNTPLEAMHVLISGWLVQKGENATIFD